MEDLPLARALTQALRLLVDEMHTRLAALGFEDLRPAHGYVLNAAAAPGGTTSSRVGELLGMTKQGAAKVVAELEAGRYVSRKGNGGDGRTRPVTLTAKGRRALAAAAAVQNELEAEWVELVGARDVKALRRVLHAVLDRGRDENGDLPPLRPTW